MAETPQQPHLVLGQEDLQRFMYACAHERHSPSTQRLIDAASYGWVYTFIHSFGDEADTTPGPGDSWLDPHDANPRKLSEYFGRVGLRLRQHPAAFDYATVLEANFHDLADSREIRPT